MTSLFSHHAYYAIGSDPERLKLVSALEKKEKIKLQGNPDFFDRTFETFTIDDSRELKALAGTRPVGEKGRKIFILAMNVITVEAQNALLKLLEEPPSYAHFFLIVRSSHLLLPTVRSRLSFLDTLLEESDVGGNKGGSRPGKALKNFPLATLTKEAVSFLKFAPARRLEVVKSLLDDISKEKKTKQDALNFLDALQAVVYEKQGPKNGMSALEAIDKARKYGTDRATSLKMLLEYVALTI